MLNRCKKEDLLLIAEEFGISVPPGVKVFELKSLIEKSEHLKKDPDFARSIIESVVEDRINKANSEQTKLELEKIKLSQLEKELEIQKIKERSAHNNPPQIADNKTPKLESLLKSVKLLTIEVPEKPEAYNLFFQSLERAFVVKNVPPEFKPEILMNILGERARNLLTYVSDEDVRDYEKLKALVLKEFQPTPYQCLIDFRRTRRAESETHVQFACRLSATFDYYCQLRKVHTFKDLCDLVVSDRLFQSLDKETMAHITIRQGEGYLKPQELGREVDVYFSSKGRTLSEVYFPKSENKQFHNIDRKIQRSYLPKNRDSKTSVKCWICNQGHFARACPNRSIKNEEYKIPECNTKIKRENFVSGISSFNEKNPTSNIPYNELKYIDIFIDGKKCNALIDSGAQLIVIKKSLFPNKHSNGFIALTSCFGNKVIAETSVFQFSLPGKLDVLELTAALSDRLIAEVLIPPRFLHMLEENNMPPELEGCGILNQIDVGRALPRGDRVEGSQLGKALSQREENFDGFFKIAGVKMRNKEDSQILKVLEEEQYFAVMNDRQKIRDEAKQNVLKIQEENRRTYKRKRKKAHQYKLGDLAAIQRKQFGDRMKLRPKFFGPYRIKAVKPHDRYDVVKVGNHEGPNSTSSAADHMKPWSTHSS